MPTGAPYGIARYKTIAVELILATRDHPLEYVFVPVGGGDGLYGLYKGWHEFLQLGLAETMPKLVAVQPVGANPVVQAVASKQATVTPVMDAWSIATATREEMAADHALRAIYGSQGLAIDVSEGEIRDAILLLARHGIAVEAASALPLAGIRKALRDGVITANARVAALLTSSLIKWPSLLADLTSRPRNVASLEELREVLVSTG
jgi:threonine synthase